MENDSKTIRSFTDLDAWKEGHKLALIMYEVTKTFPKEEIFSLIMQMRRAAVSITSNIAEGFSRQSYKEKLQFYSISLGSLTELQNQSLVARDVKFMSEVDFQRIAQQSLRVSKLVNGLIKKCRSVIRDT